MKGLLLVIEIITGLILFLTIVSGNAEFHHYIILIGDIITLVFSIIDAKTS